MRRHQKLPPRYCYISPNSVRRSHSPENSRKLLNKKKKKNQHKEAQYNVVGKLTVHLNGR